MYYSNIARHFLAHILGVTGTWVSMYGLFVVRGPAGLLCCALGGGFIGAALARLGERKRWAAGVRRMPKQRVPAWRGSMQRTNGKHKPSRWIAWSGDLPLPWLRFSCTYQYRRSPTIGSVAGPIDGIQMYHAKLTYRVRLKPPRRASFRTTEGACHAREEDRKECEGRQTGSGEAGC